jgi:hypothetical protein
MIIPTALANTDVMMNDAFRGMLSHIQPARASEAAGVRPDTRLRISDYVVEGDEYYPGAWQKLERGQ